MSEKGIMGPAVYDVQEVRTCARLCLNEDGSMAVGCVIVSLEATDLNGNGMIDAMISLDPQAAGLMPVRK